MKYICLRFLLIVAFASGGFGAIWDDGGAGHDFGTAANWDTDTVPAASAVLYIRNPAALDPNGPVVSSGTYPATGSYGSIQVGGAFTGDGNDVNAAVLTVNGGSLTGATLYAGLGGATGKLKITGGSVTGNKGLVVGNGATSPTPSTGYFEMTGGTLTVTNEDNPNFPTRIGTISSSSDPDVKGIGIAVMSGGVINTSGTGNAFAVGHSLNANANPDDAGQGIGTFNFTGGTINAGSGFYVGYSQSGIAAAVGDNKAVGTMTMSGVNTRLNVTGSFLVGYLLNGNTNSYTSGEFIMDGGYLSATAGVSVSSYNYGTNCTINGTFTLNAGLVEVNAPNIYIGNGANHISSGDGGLINATLNINGGTFKYIGTTAADIEIGRRSYKNIEVHGALNMTGGLLQNTNGGILMGWNFANLNANSTAKIQMTGGTIDLSGALSVGFHKDGYPDSICDVNFFGGRINASDLTIADGSQLQIKNDVVLTLSGNKVSDLNTLIGSGKITTEPLGDILAAYDDSNGITRLTCTPPVYNYDINGDLAVNFEDFAVIVYEWLDTACESVNYYCNGADIDHDGEVTMVDAAIFSEEWLAVDETAANVIAYYTFDDDVYDSTANKYDGTAVNLSYSADVPVVIGAGKSLSWADVSIARYAAVPTVRGIGNKFTVTMWVKIPSEFTNTDGYRALLSNQTPTENGFTIAANTWNADNRRLILETDNDVNLLNAGTPDSAISKGLWHHLAVVRDGMNCTFYVDGNNVGYYNSDWDNVLSDFGITNSLRIGANMQAGDAQCWVGNIDDVAIWDGIADEDTIAKLAAGNDSPASHMISPARCVAYYTFDDTWNDSAGLAYHGSATSVSYSTDVPSAIGSGKSASWADESIARYITLPEIPELGNEFTVSMWVKIPSAFTNTSGYRSLLSNNVPTASGFSIVADTWNSDNRRLTFLTVNEDANTLDAGTPDDAISKGVWHHIVITRNGEDCAFYVDGINTGYYNKNSWSKVLSDFGLKGQLRIGANWQGGNANCWVGWIDDVAVWKGVLSNNIIRNLYDGIDSPANHYVPSWWSTSFIDEMKPFYRSHTMVESWLESGGGIMAVPTHWTTAGDFPYQKRPYSKEGYFTDEFFLVRPLGGWTSGDAGDVAYRVGGVINYDWSKLDGRITPYIDYGYNKPTLVLDNVCWCFPTSPANGSFGQKMPPADMDEWYDFIEAACNHLSATYGSSVVKKWNFRVGTEIHDQGRWDFTNTEMKSFYDHTTEAVLSVFSNAKVGPGNYYQFTDSSGITQQELIQHCASGTNYVTGLTGSAYDFSSRSLYMGSSSFRDPRAAAANYMSECDTIDSILGYAAPREIHEFGVLQNEWGTETDEPGAYGAAWTFSIIMGLYSEGTSKIQHWHAYEAGATSLLRGRFWPYMVLDHMLGGDTYKIPSPADSLSGTQYEAYVVDKGGKKHILISAFNTSRNTVDSRSVNFTVPREMISIAETSTIEETRLTTSTSVQDQIRADFAANGLLVSPWTTETGAIGAVSAMGGSVGLSYVADHLSTYQSMFADSLTLKSFTGTFSKTSTDYQFTVTIANPTVLVIAITE